MGDISQKTLGELIDQLLTNSLRCWFAQEKVGTETDPKKVAEAAKIAQATNVIRNQLIRAINAYSNELDRTPLEKTYDK